LRTGDDIKVLCSFVLYAVLLEQISIASWDLGHKTAGDRATKSVLEDVITNNAEADILFFVYESAISETQ